MNDFKTLFGRAPAVAARAPGRVNLIGEHTDYNGGFVLPMAIPQRTSVEMAPRRDETIRIWSHDKPDGILTYTLGQEWPRKNWLDYIQGVTRILHREHTLQAGFDARVESTVPLGSGLSSSASLTVSLIRALRETFPLPLEDVEIARIAQRAENDFVGAHVGIMDPMAASLADEHTALFLDADSLAYERVPFPAGVDLIVIHSGVSHRLAGGDYNTRRAECEKACALLGIRQLRDLSVAELPRVGALPEPLNRRARHVVTENDRVLEAVAAMRANDVRRLGALFYASHASMRDDYNVSVPEIDLLVELARKRPAIYGARLTGGGFGGSVVMLAQGGKGSEEAMAIAREYVQRAGGRPRILVPENTG